MDRSKYRIEKRHGQSLRNWERMNTPETRNMKEDAWVEMGWGRLVFAHTFKSNPGIVDAMCSQGYDTRDIAMYIIDPHVVVALAPDKLFLDPSHTFRMWSHDYRPCRVTTEPFTIHRLSTMEEANEINRIYAACHMKGADPEFILDNRAGKERTYLVAKAIADKKIVGSVTGVDHVRAFKDPEKGTSLWSLAVDPQCDLPGVGMALVRHLLEHYFTKGRAFVDISVMHDNENAIKLYEKLGFKRIPAFCIKRKNPINEHLFVAHAPGAHPGLNPYARLIVDEARKRGISIDILNAEFGLFRLTLGCKSITCRESLSEMTTAIAMTKCDNKRLTSSILKKAGINVPRQILHDTLEGTLGFMEEVKQVVVKPVKGEQGDGISVDISTRDGLENALGKAGEVCPQVIVEEFVRGDDLRIIVINREVVAAALRKPPSITGTGKHTIEVLIEKYNRRRMAATGGESSIPMDGETIRCIGLEGYKGSDILASGEVLTVRKTANLHTGGTIHDVTERLSPTLRDVALKSAAALDIPVTGLDLMVRDVEGEDYAVIEANERPGLANHEPQPTAQKFIDFLFPETIIHGTVHGDGPR
ncbi:MAG: N-acetylglutaminylglutamine synthetase [Desulfamplus sp.]|nr:N-acetylglutaminylglutamine synthetase [Desulfamplus sp.]